MRKFFIQMWKKTITSTSFSWVVILFCYHFSQSGVCQCFLIKRCILCIICASVLCRSHETQTHTHTHQCWNSYSCSVDAFCYLLVSAQSPRTGAEVFVAGVSVELYRLRSAIIFRCEKLIRGGVVSGFHSNLVSSVARVFQDVPAFTNKDCFLNSASD